MESCANILQRSVPFLLVLLYLRKYLWTRYRNTTYCEVWVDYKYIKSATIALNPIQSSGGEHPTRIGDSVQGFSGDIRHFKISRGRASMLVPGKCFMECNISLFSACSTGDCWENNTLGCYYFSLNWTTASNCPSATFYDVNSSTCTMCEITCATCMLSPTQEITCPTCLIGQPDENGICPVPAVLPTDIIPCNSICLVCDENGICTSCKDGYYASADDGKCYACSADCVSCIDAATCTHCETNYFIKEGACAECPTNCTTCEENGICTRCQDGFRLYGTLCLICSQNCADCNADQGCLTCLSGFYLSTDGLCNPCGSKNCRLCDKKDALGSCYECLDSFYLTANNFCVSCPLSCETCNDAGLCLKCQDKYYLTIDGKCLPCSPLPCVACANITGACTLCKQPYWLDLITEECKTCPDHCEV